VDKVQEIDSVLAIIFPDEELDDDSLLVQLLREQEDYLA